MEASVKETSEPGEPRCQELVGGCIGHPQNKSSAFGSLLFDVFTWATTLESSCGRDPGLK